MRSDYIEPRMKALEMTHKIEHSAQVVKTLRRKSVVFMFRFQPPTTVFYTSSSINVIHLIHSFAAL